MAATMASGTVKIEKGFMGVCWSSIDTIFIGRLEYWGFEEYSTLPEQSPGAAPIPGGLGFTGGVPANWRGHALADALDSKIGLGMPAFEKLMAQLVDVSILPAK